MDFSDALRAVKAGATITRTGWNGPDQPDQHVALQTPDEHSKMRKPYLYISPVDGELVPWLASQADLLAEDWWLVGAPKTVAPPAEARTD